MQIKDLKPKQGNVDVTADVIDVGEPREFQKFGKSGRVATAIIKDESGDCKLSLWNDDVDKIKAGDRIQITNGYVNEWQGEKQLTTGRMGKLEVLTEGKKEIDKDAEVDKKEFEGKATDDSDDKLVTDEESIEDDEI